MAKKETKKTKIDKAKEEEALSIIAKANETKGEQLSVTEAGKLITKKELKDYAIGNIDDPARKFEIYYKGINKLLRKNLPKGKENKVARDFIYEEKNTFLTRGKRKNKMGVRGADGRMGYITDAEAILKIVMDWVISNDSDVNLFTTLRELNKSMGYGTRQF
jgi:hypothetical protein